MLLNEVMQVEGAEFAQCRQEPNAKELMIQRARERWGGRGRGGHTEVTRHNNAEPFFRAKKLQLFPEDPRP